jgi:hypothetical protein
MKADLCFGFSAEEWKPLSQKLDGDESAWAEAINVFEKRMRERFLTSIEALFAADTKPDLQSSDSTNAPNCIPGFSILALCCLLIETVQGFRESTPSEPHSAGPCTFPSGSCIKPSTDTNQRFIKFLRRPAFGGVFDGNIANSFVRGIRNGILHEAETRKWVIWRDEPMGVIAKPEDDGFALNRSLFYAAVKNEFESYLRELRDPTNDALRKRFKKKMSDLCRRA